MPSATAPVVFRHTSSAAVALRSLKGQTFAPQKTVCPLRYTSNLY